MHDQENEPRLTYAEWAKIHEESERWYAKVREQRLLRQFLASFPEHQGPPSVPAACTSHMIALERQAKTADAAGDLPAARKLRRLAHGFRWRWYAATVHNFVELREQLLEAVRLLRRFDRHSGVHLPLWHVAKALNGFRYEPLMLELVQRVRMAVEAWKRTPPGVLRILMAAERSFIMSGPDLWSALSGSQQAMFDEKWGDRWRSGLRCPHEYPCFRPSRERMAILRNESIREPEARSAELPVDSASS